MTNIEFNKKYELNLEAHHYGCQLPYKEMIDYVDKEFEQLAVDQSFSYSQIKMKFGMSRVYISDIKAATRIENKLDEIYKRLENERKNNANIINLDDG